MTHNYDLRSNQKSSTQKRNKKEDTKDFPQSLAHASDETTDDELDESPVVVESASDSFSFHSRQQPRKQPEKLYPDLPNSSPRTTRRPRNTFLEKQDTLDKTKKTTPAQDTKRNGCDVKLICVSIIFIVLGVMVWSQISTHSNNDSQDEPPKKFDSFKHAIGLLASEFPNQPPQLWKNVQSCVKHVLDSEDPSYPGVLLLAASNDNGATAFKIAQQIGEKYEASMQSSVTRAATFDISKELDGLDAEKQKLTLDKWLHDHLGGTSRAVVLHHLEHLMPEAALLLHGYCDGDNAPYKNALIILVYVDKISNNARDIENALGRLWNSGLPEDKVSALLSRVANNIGIII